MFGSTARSEPGPRDLDVAVLTGPGDDLDLLAAMDDLVALSGVEAVDVVQLNRGGPVLKKRALVECVTLYVSSPPLPHHR